MIQGIRSDREFVVMVMVMTVWLCDGVAQQCGCKPADVYFVVLGLLVFASGRGQRVHVCPRPCSSTYRWAKLYRRKRPHSLKRQAYRNISDHVGHFPLVWRVLSWPLLPVTTACVTARERGRHHKLVHAARHGHD